MSLSSSVHSPKSYYSSSLLSSNEKKDPHKVATLFESIFYKNYLKLVRESREEDLLSSGLGSDQIREMWDEELAHYLGSLGKLGIARQVTEDLKRRGEIE